MICILLILIIIAVIVYFAFDDISSIVPIIVLCLFVVVIATCVVFIIASCFSIVDEYELCYDSYSISHHTNLFSSGTIYYYHDEQLLKISANTIDVFEGDTIGKFVIQERRFNSPKWFWLIAFIPDDMLLRTDVLIV